MSAIVKIQEILGVTADGIWGPKVTGRTKLSDRRLQ